MQFFSYSSDQFQELTGASGVPLEYLKHYLRDLGATTIAREAEYVDRHYLEDFANYYSRSFRPPDSKTSRLHFFSGGQDVGGLINEFYSAALARRKEIADSLSSNYLGFIVKRPLPQAPLGRTVLKPYSRAGGRNIEVVRPYHVHLGAIPLEVHGLAYQQQDGGAAVCATTAIWSALQRVACMSGHRTPTPSEITDAAGNAFPAAHGLNRDQMGAAIARLGYTVDTFVPGTHAAEFKALVVACLDSKLPVILFCKTARGVGHTVTVTGYSEGKFPFPVQGFGDDPVLSRGGAVDTIYVHDDNVGPHIHYEFLDPKEGGDPDDAALLRLLRGDRKREIKGWDIDEPEILYALVPKPLKFRMPMASVFRQVGAMRRQAELLFPDKKLDYACRIASGVEYKHELVEMNAFQEPDLRAFVERPFPRHIGIVHVELSGRHVCDFLFDITQVDRNREMANALAIVAPGVPSRTLEAKNVEQFGQTHQIAVLIGL